MVKSSRQSLRDGLCIMAQNLSFSFSFFHWSMMIKYICMHKLQWNMWKLLQHFVEKGINAANLKLNILVTPSLTCINFRS